MFELKLSTLNNGLLALALLSLVFNSYFGGVAALTFILSGISVFFLNIKNTDKSIITVLVSLPLLICFYFLSTSFFSSEPAHTLRMTIQLLLTTFIAYYFSRIINLKTFIKVLALISLLTALVNLINGRYVVNGLTHELNLVGVFASKNFLAVHTTLGLIAGLYLLIFSNEKIQRLLGFFCALLAVLIIIKAKSLGVAFSVLLTILLSVIFRSEYFKSKFLNNDLNFFNFFAITAVSASTLLFYYFFNGFFDYILLGLNKDPTLTGRTFIWEIGISAIHDNFLTGVGYKTFFTLSNFGALEIWEYFRIPDGAGFNFHNMYINITVETGIIGLFFLLSFIYKLMKEAYFFNEKEGFFIRCVIYFLFLQTFLEANMLSQFTLVHFTSVYIYYTCLKQRV